MNHAVPSFPLSLFPHAQMRIRALLEDADEEAHAGASNVAERLISKARQDAAALRAEIVGIS